MPGVSVFGEVVLNEFQPTSMKKRKHQILKCPRQQKRTCQHTNSQLKADDAMHICEHVRAGAKTYILFTVKSQHTLPGPVCDFGVQVSQEHILCSLLAFLKIDGTIQHNKQRELMIKIYSI
jgi:hypothetical protein